MSRSTVAAALLLALTSGATAADPAPDAAESRPWYKRVFGGSAEEKSPPVTNRPAAAPPPAPTWKDVSRSLEQERAVYMERLLYCTRLRQIAEQTRDEELARKADQLEEMAEAVYSKRTRTLPTIVEDVKAAEAALDQRRPSGAPAGTAAVPARVVGRSPNGRPIIEGGNR